MGPCLPMFMTVLSTSHHRDMSRKPDSKSSDEEKSSDEDGKDYHFPVSHYFSKSEDDLYNPESFEEASSSHDDLSEFSHEILDTSVTLRSRGPGRPRIHPLKPLGASRPRGRPKGSRNKKPRKRLEKPPKRPRGRPRKWPPEMWEGFQRTRHVVQQRLRHHIHPQQELPGSSRTCIEPADDPGEALHSFSSPVHLQHHFHPSSHHHPASTRPHLPQYMPISLQAEQPLELSLGMQQRPTLEIDRSSSTPTAVLSHLGHPHEQDATGFLWMHHMTSEEQLPSTTSS